jgi:hypothetical protein
MRNLVICGLFLLVLAMNSQATAPIQLSGSNGQTILSQVARPIPIPTANASTNTSLWNWGSVPAGYALNKSGALNPLDGTPLSNDYNIWTPSI